MCFLALAGRRGYAFVAGAAVLAMVKLVVAPTDIDWFMALSGQHDPGEVNFWSPSESNFRALQPGELFLFKLKAPHNAIGGGGVFAYSNVLPCSLAWEAFGEANGASSLARMRQQISGYKASSRDRSEARGDFKIGCRILTQPFFLPRERWLPLPQDWKRNIVSLKTYDTAEAIGLKLWNDATALMAVAPGLGVAQELPRYGSPHVIRPRLGQGAFRVVVTDSYQRRCAVTGEKTLPALDAAHIQPYSEGGRHDISNGLLLRRDIHSLFDSGYVTVTTDMRFEVSQRIKEEFENGRDYYGLQGKPLLLPKRVEDRPAQDALAWHNNECYVG